MNLLTEWVSTIIIFILLATIITMILPNSNIQKYVKMVVGLILIVIILNPIFKLLQSDLSEALSAFDSEQYVATESIENTINEKKKEIQQNERAYILEQMAIQMKKEVEEELETNYQFQIVDLTVVADEEKDSIASTEDIQAIQVVVQSKTEEGDIPAIKDVEIDTEKPLDQENENAQIEQLQTFFAGKWQLSADQIVVSEEGGK